MVQYRNGITPGRMNDLIGYNYHSLQSVGERNFVFECHLTVDERYFVLHDEVFDIQEQTKLGNIWDSIDIFKTIFKNVQIDNPEYRNIQEGWESLPILEGQNNLHALRDFLLEWSFFDDTWVGRKLKGAGTAIKDTVVDSWEGIKKFGVAISKGDWSEILNLLGKGVLFVLRKLKSAAYSTIGIIVDAILVATGVGKGFQMAVWGLITALDVYQLSTGDYPDDEKDNPMWYKIMELGFDVLGLVTAGVAAKGARAIFKPLSGLKLPQMAAKVAKSPAMKSFIKKIHAASKSGVSKLSGLQKTIASKWGAGGRFIASILGKMGDLMKKLQKYCGDILKRSNLKNVTKGKDLAPGRGYVQTAKSGSEFAKRALVPGTLAGTVMYGVEKLTGADGEQPNNTNTGREFRDDDFNLNGGPVMGVELDQDALDL